MAVFEPRHGDVGLVIGCVEEERVVRSASEPDVDAVVVDRDVGWCLDEVPEQRAGLCVLLAVAEADGQ